MTERILLVSTADPRCRQLEDLLADARTTLRDLNGSATPWEGAAPDLLVVGALGGTQQATELVQAALAVEPELSVLVVDDPESWPEALRHMPGLLVVPPGQRTGFVAARVQLMERRRLLRERRVRQEAPADRLAARALESDQPAVREMRMMLERLVDGRGALVVAGERGTLRRRLLTHVLQEREALDEFVLVDDIDALSPVRQGEVLEKAQGGLRIAATATTSFRSRVQEGSFRSDLYYAIGGTPVNTVPLRERRADMQRLLVPCGIEAVTEGAVARLTAYDWPGNLRELELVVEHALILSGGDVVHEAHLPLPELGEAEVPDTFVLHIPQSGISLEAVEREAIRQTLEASDANVAEAARRLDIERGKLRYRLRRHGLGR